MAFCFTQSLSFILDETHYCVSRSLLQTMIPCHNALYNCIEYIIHLSQNAILSETLVHCAIHVVMLRPSLVSHGLML